MDEEGGRTRRINGDAAFELSESPRVSKRPQGTRFELLKVVETEARNSVLRPSIE